VEVTVLVEDAYAPSGTRVADAEVELILGGKTIVATTDSDGQARLRLSSDQMDIVNANAPDGTDFFVVVMHNSYYRKDYSQQIRPDEKSKTIELAITPRS